MNRLLPLCLIVVALTVCSCIPVTETAYPLLTYQTAKPVQKNHFAVRAGGGVSSAVRSDANLNVPSPTYDRHNLVVQGGFSYGLSRAVSMDGDFVYGSGSTYSIGFRAGPRIRLSKEAAKVTVALQPAIVAMTADDLENNMPSTGEYEDLQSNLTSYEVRLPATYHVRKWLDLTAAAGVSYSHFADHFSASDPDVSHWNRRREWISPIFTVGCRAGFVMLEVGAHQLHGHWQSAVGLGFGKW